MKKVFVAVLLVALVVAGGCKQTYVTVSDNKVTENVSASYEFGKLTSVLSRDVATLVTASEKLNDLKMPVVSKSQDKLVAKVEGYTSDGKDVVINITSLSEGACRLTIVVGSRLALGDETRSRAIFQAILENGGWGDKK